MNLDELKPGPELDALIAEKVMGLSLFQRERKSSSGVRWKERLIDDPWKRRPIPAYSTSISAAWEVVEKLFIDGWKMELEASAFLGEDRGGAGVRFSCRSQVRGRHSASAPTAPMAICLAALRVVESKA